MKNIIKLAWRNLTRYKRRTLLTSSLITLGVALVIVFSGIGNSFKSEVIGIITDSNLGDLQIHKKGYVGSIDNLPLDLTISDKNLKKIQSTLAKYPQIESTSSRIRFSGMISNYAQTTNMRFTAVDPVSESKTCTALTERIKDGDKGSSSFVKPGSLVIPLNIATGLDLKVGSDVVLVATNKDGSVNGMPFKISGISENILGPQGKDGYIHIDDARSLLRVEDGSITEIAIKLNDFNALNQVYSGLKKDLLAIKNEKSGKPVLEIHSWEDLSPFSSIAKIVTLLIMVVRIVLISIVLISILNVMMMSVYERIGEIGTLASIGTLPSKILSLFLSEGLLLGFFSAITGNLLGIIILIILNISRINFVFGNMNITLAPQLPFMEVIATIAIVMVISAIASLQPAIKASRMEPVEALRHV